MKELKLFELHQESTYRYAGITSFRHLLELTADYPFDEDVMEKAEIHKSAMNTPFSVTLRISPDAVLSEMKDIFTFSFEEFDIRDGRSKCAALRLLEPDYLDGFHIRLDIFALDKENMDSL